MINLGGHILAAMDTETTGSEPGYHEVIQISVVPLEPISLEPDPRYAPFYTCICPSHLDRLVPDAMAAHGIPLDQLLTFPNQESVADNLREWFLGLGLPVGKKIIPICHNLVFDQPMTAGWLGEPMYNEIFARNGRCTLNMAAYINDREAYAGRAAPFNRLSLASLCSHFGVQLDNAHDALADCLATAKIYKHLLKVL